MQENITTDKSKYLPIIISVSFGAFMVCLDTYIVNVSLPSISKYFNVSTNVVSWVIMAYLLMVTSFMLIFGKLEDKVGLKKIFILGYFFFTLGSLFCGFSSHIGMLIASRCIQGLGGAMLYTSASAIIPKFLPKNIIGWAFGILSTAAALGVTVGAPLGGFITGFFSWHGIFLINIPIGIVAILAAIKIIPENKPAPENREEIKEEEKEIAFDVIGSVLSVLGIVLLLYALNMGQEKGWGSPIILSCFAGFVVFIVIFLLWESKHPDPLLDLKLFKNRNFTLGTLAVFMAFVLTAGSNFLLPFYLELIKGLKVEQVGLVMMLYSVIYMLIGPFAGRLSDKIAPRVLCSAGMISAACACFVFSFILKEPGILPVVIFLVWLAASYGLFISPNSNLVMSSIPEGKQGIASAVFRTSWNLSLVLGVCFFETIFSHSLPANLTSLAGANISPDALFSGFHNAYILGGFTCLAAFLFSMFSKTKK